MPKKRTSYFAEPVLAGRVVRGRKNPLCLSVGSRLQQARERANLTVASLGIAARMSHQVVRSIEEGANLPLIDTLERIAAALGVSPCWLAYGTEGTEPFSFRKPVPQGPDAEMAGPDTVFHRTHKLVGERCRTLREARGFSLRQLAAAAGISVQTVANTESGKTVPKVDNVERLAVALQCAPCWLAFGIGSSGSRQ